jgi:hypothetical protein
MSHKLEKVLNLLEELSDIYPNLEKVILNDTEDPDYLIITSTDFINEMADSFGISDEFAEADIDDIYQDIPKSKKKRKIQ